jgi:hypothetical protein
VVQRIGKKRFTDDVQVAGSIASDSLFVSGVEVDTSNASNNQALVFDGAKFSPTLLSGGASVSETPPTSPSEGDIWFDSSDATTYVYYNNFWVEVGPPLPDVFGEIISSKGDLLVASSPESVVRLGAGANGQFLTSNSSTVSGLEWFDLSINISAEAPISYNSETQTISIDPEAFSPKYFTERVVTSNTTLLISDVGRVVTFNSSSLSILTVPTNASVPFPIGTVINVYRAGTGSVLISSDSGVTVRNAGSIASQYLEVSLRKRLTNEWVLSGSVI